jgi:hypothetical protein
MFDKCFHLLGKLVKNPSRYPKIENLPDAALAIFSAMYDRMLNEEDLKKVSNMDSAKQTVNPIIEIYGKDLFQEGKAEVAAALLKDPRSSHSMIIQATELSEKELRDIADKLKAEKLSDEELKAIEKTLSRNSGPGKSN